MAIGGKKNEVSTFMFYHTSICIYIYSNWQS